METMCIWIGDGHPKYVLMQPMEKEAFETLAAEADLIKKEVSVPFCIIGIAVESWNRDLSPWEAELVFGQEKFGGQAAAFLERIETVFLPRNRIAYLNGIRAIIFRIRSSVLREALYGC